LGVDGTLSTNEDQVICGPMKVCISVSDAGGLGGLVVALIGG
jgi:hypothetical protein